MIGPLCFHYVSSETQTSITDKYTTVFCKPQNKQKQLYNNANCYQQRSFWQAYERPCTMYIKLKLDGDIDIPKLKSSNIISSSYKP